MSPAPNTDSATVVMIGFDAEIPAAARDNDRQAVVATGSNAAWSLWDKGEAARVGPQFPA